MRSKIDCTLCTNSIQLVEQSVALYSSAEGNNR